MAICVIVLLIYRKMKAPTSVTTEKREGPKEGGEIKGPNPNLQTNKPVSGEAQNVVVGAQKVVDELIEKPIVSAKTMEIVSKKYPEVLPILENINVTPTQVLTAKVNESINSNSFPKVTLNNTGAAFNTDTPQINTGPSAMTLAKVAAFGKKVGKRT